MLVIDEWRAESTTRTNTLPWRASRNTAYAPFEFAANEYQRAESAVTSCSMTRPTGTRSPSPRGSNGESLQAITTRSEEHTSELQSHSDLVCRLLLEKKKTTPHKP